MIRMVIGIFIIIPSSVGTIAAILAAISGRGSFGVASVELCLLIIGNLIFAWGKKAHRKAKLANESEV